MDMTIKLMHMLGQIDRFVWWDGWMDLCGGMGGWIGVDGWMN